MLDMSHSSPPLNLVAAAVTTTEGVGAPELDGRVAGVVAGEVEGRTDGAPEFVSDATGDEGASGEDSLGRTAVVSDGRGASVLLGTSVGRADSEVGGGSIVAGGEFSLVGGGRIVAGGEFSLVAGGRTVAGGEFSLVGGATGVSGCWVVTGTSVGMASEVAGTVGAAGRLTELVTVPFTPVTGTMAVDTGFPSE